MASKSHCLFIASISLVLFAGASPSGIAGSDKLIRPPSAKDCEALINGAFEQQDLVQRVEADRIATERFDEAAKVAQQKGFTLDSNFGMTELANELYTGSLLREPVVKWALAANIPAELRNIREIEHWLNSQRSSTLESRKSSKELQTWINKTNEELNLLCQGSVASIKAYNERLPPHIRSQVEPIQFCANWRVFNQKQPGLGIFALAQGFANSGGEELRTIAVEAGQARGDLSELRWWDPVRLGEILRKMKTSLTTPRSLFKKKEITSPQLIPSVASYPNVIENADFDANLSAFDTNLIVAHQNRSLILSRFADHLNGLYPQSRDRILRFLLLGHDRLPNQLYALMIDSLLVPGSYNHDLTSARIIAAPVELDDQGKIRRIPEVPVLERGLTSQDKVPEIQNSLESAHALSLKTSVIVLKFRREDGTPFPTDQSSNGYYLPTGLEVTAAISRELKPGSPLLNDFNTFTDHGYLQTVTAPGHETAAFTLARIQFRLWAYPAIFRATPLLIEEKDGLLTLKSPSSLDEQE